MNTERPYVRIDEHGVMRIGHSRVMLEAIVASADGATLPAGAIQPTTWDAELLAAQAEYTSPAAYDIIRGSAYPFDLPFDLWAEEGRRYLTRMGIARDEVMRVMPAHSDVTAIDVASETLGMSKQERSLICQPSSDAAVLGRRWGLRTARAASFEGLSRLEKLLTRAHVDYDRLSRLLNTRFINPGRAIAVSFAAAPCSVEDAVLIGQGGRPARVAARTNTADARSTASSLSAASTTSWAP